MKRKLLEILHWSPLVFGILSLVGYYFISASVLDASHDIDIIVGFIGVLGFIATLIANIVLIPKNLIVGRSKLQSTTPIILLVVSIATSAAAIFQTIANHCAQDERLLYVLMISSAVTFGLAAGLRYQLQPWPVKLWARGSISLLVAGFSGVTAYFVVWSGVITAAGGIFACYNF